MARILIVEDDEVIADGLQVMLSKDGHEVFLANNGDDGLYLAKTQHPDLMVLDIMMPMLNGFEVITELRRSGSDMPIIVLSARVATNDKVRGLDLGADDYMTKPFEIEELLARIRRRVNERRPSITAIGSKSYDWESQTLREAEEVIPLTTREQKFLEYVLKRPNRIISRDQIIENVWGDEYDGSDRTVDNFVVRLRRKIGNDFIVTVRGQGYRFTKK